LRFFLSDRLDSFFEDTCFEIVLGRAMIISTNVCVIKYDLELRKIKSEP